MVESVAVRDEAMLRYTRASLKIRIREEEEGWHDRLESSNITPTTTIVDENVFSTKNITSLTSSLDGHSVRADAGHHHIENAFHYKHRASLNDVRQRHIKALEEVEELKMKSKSVRGTIDRAEGKVRHYSRYSSVLHLYVERDRRSCSLD